MSDKVASFGPSGSSLVNSRWPSVRASAPACVFISPGGKVTAQRRTLQGVVLLISCFRPNPRPRHAGAVWAGRPGEGTAGIVLRNSEENMSWLDAQPPHRCRGNVPGPNADLQVNAWRRESMTSGSFLYITPSLFGSIRLAIPVEIYSLATVKQYHPIYRAQPSFAHSTWIPRRSIIRTRSTCPTTRSGPRPSRITMCPLSMGHEFMAS